MKKRRFTPTVVVEYAIIGGASAYRTVLRWSFALIVSMVMISPGYAQKNSGFDDFIKTLEKTAAGNRQKVTEQFMGKIDRTPIIEGGRVHFVWFGNADTVLIEGELQNSWAIPKMMTKIDCGAKDLFHVSYTVPADAFLQYLFRIDGQKIVDIKNPRVSKGFDFTDRNFFSMPGYVESVNLKDRHDIGKGSVVQWIFRTQHAPFTNMPIWIYTPYGYSKDKKYPVLYVYDGSSTVYTRPLINVVNNLIHDQAIEPIVMVFVGVEDRWTEYVSESKEFAKLITEELVPFVEKNFGVANTADKRGIVGASASGHGAIVTAMFHPDVFGNVASQGGGAGGYPGLNPIANEALDAYLQKKDTSPLRKIYTEVGSYDLEFPEEKIIFADGVDQFNKRLTENKIDYVFRKVTGGHNSAIWDQNLDNILILFFGR
jgi:enterochelin esterase-like enzyme